jgi:hypothetical protein
MDRVLDSSGLGYRPVVGLNKVIIFLVLCNMVGCLEQLSDCQLFKKGCAARRGFSVLQCSERDRQTDCSSGRADARF